MDLLERSSLLEELSDVLAATAACGRVVLLADEVGISKSALVKRFTSGGRRMRQGPPDDRRCDGRSHSGVVLVTQ
jgi:hypothetical protein